MKERSLEWKGMSMISGRVGSRVGVISRDNKGLNR